MRLKIKEPQWKIVCIFNSVWLVYYILELFSGNIQGTYSVLINLIVPVLFLSIMSYIFYTLSNKNVNGFTNKKAMFIIFILIIIEQGTKQVIRNTGYIGSNYAIIGNWLYFCPVVNTLGSWGASRFGLTLGIRVFLIINIIFIPLVIEIYRFYIEDNIPSFWISNTFILCFSGIICSMIDKMFFGGSLDFLMLKGLFVADIKDFYITLSICCLLTEVLLNSRFMNKSSNGSDWDLFKRFVMFNMNDIKRIKKFFKKL